MNPARSSFCQMSFVFSHMLHAHLNLNLWLHTSCIYVQDLICKFAGGCIIMREFHYWICTVGELVWPKIKLTNPTFICLSVMNSNLELPSPLGTIVTFAAPNNWCKIDKKMLHIFSKQVISHLFGIKKLALYHWIVIAAEQTYQCQLQKLKPNRKLQ